MGCRVTLDTLQYSLRIEGFRKHKDTTILFSDSTFLIGENNVGKSSVLVALDYLLNIKSKIPEEEFYSVVDANGSIIRKVNEVILTAEFRNLYLSGEQVGNKDADVTHSDT